ncbi:hypothetical protein HW555_005160 [Spodoptera exigua]|uniref:Uncharacterized protein n=1 Tax=Spodoptera exigua TaxID=7107 RepID=A0A835GJN7_SPOEX|nr:hypothetical protein HW555_005160 [Spodoptera exigua]
MIVKLYTYHMSPPVRACMMVCDIFNVPFEKIPVDLQAGEHLTPEFLKKNPIHQVPVMEDGDLILHDSHAILPYLADTYGKDDSWYPNNIKKRALGQVVMTGKKTIEKELLDDALEGYSFLEAFLSRSKYIAADHVTIADIAILSVMTSLSQILPVDLHSKLFCIFRYPKTTVWLEHLKEMPYCKKYNEEGANALAALVKSRVA